MSREWTKAELHLMQDMWMEGKKRTVRSVKEAFPGRSYRAICSKAWAMGYGKPRLAPGEGAQAVLEALRCRKMTTAQLKVETGYSLDVLRGILKELRRQDRVVVASSLAPPRGGHPLNVWAAVGSPDAPTTIIDQLRPLADNPFRHMLV